MPGPGNYNIKEMVGSEAPKFSFGKDGRGTMARPMTPGPGTYNLKNITGTEGPKITMSGHRPNSASSSRYVPGVGQYNLNLNDKRKSPSFRMGTSTRGANFRETVPGPGTYRPCDNVSTRPKSPTWSMGTGTRRPLSSSSSNPGPGNYSVISKVGEGPKVRSLFMFFSFQ